MRFDQPHITEIAPQNSLARSAPVYNIYKPLSWHWKQGWFIFVTLTVIREEFAKVLKWSLYNHWVGYSKLVRQKQLRKALLQCFYLRSLIMITKGQIQVSIRLKV